MVDALVEHATRGEDRELFFVLLEEGLVIGGDAFDLLSDKNKRTWFRACLSMQGISK